MPKTGSPPPGGHDPSIERTFPLYQQATGRWFSCTIYPHQEAQSSRSPHFVVTISDTSELKTLTESLEITNQAIDKERQELQYALDEISFLLQEVEKEEDLTLRFRNEEISTSGPVYHIADHFNRMMDKLEHQHKELEKAYGDLKAAQSKILQQEKMASIGQLAAGIAHEINNPMGFVISNLGTLQKYSRRLSEFIDLQARALREAEVHPALRDTLDTTERSLKIAYIKGDIENLIKESLEGADRVKKIVQDLKRFSRVDETDFSPSDINAGLESTINIVWNELKYKATLQKEYGNIPLTYCNQGQLNQVFMNILINAAHAIKEQGVIAVKTWHRDDHVYISISDNGCGIPEKDLGRIFEPFFTSKDVGKGTGLGLSIAYDIIKKHHGEIDVESTVGQGTTFTIKIPVR